MVVVKDVDILCVVAIVVVSSSSFLFPFIGDMYLDYDYRRTNLGVIDVAGVVAAIIIIVDAIGPDQEE